MECVWKQAIWSQFGAAIDMLESAIRACPETLWSDPAQTAHWPSHDVVGLWHLAHHRLFWLDSYLTEAPAAFAPPTPFTTIEFEPGAQPFPVLLQKSWRLDMQCRPFCPFGCPPAAICARR